MSAAVEGFRY